MHTRNQFAMGSARLQQVCSVRVRWLFCQTQHNQIRGIGTGVDERILFGPLFDQVVLRRRVPRLRRVEGEGVSIDAGRAEGEAGRFEEVTAGSVDFSLHELELQLVLINHPPKHQTGPRRTERFVRQ